MEKSIRFFLVVSGVVLGLGVLENLAIEFLPSLPWKLATLAVYVAAVYISPFVVDGMLNRKWKMPGKDWKTPFVIACLGGIIAPYAFLFFTGLI